LRVFYEIPTRLKACPSVFFYVVKIIVLDGSIKRLMYRFKGAFALCALATRSLTSSPIPNRISAMLFSLLYLPVSYSEFELDRISGLSYIYKYQDRLIRGKRRRRFDRKLGGPKGSIEASPRLYFFCL
jgi:hypothetical protein